MMEIILTTAAGITLLVGFSFFIVWYEEQSKRRARYRYLKRFEFIDKYMAEMETASERELERLKKERIAIFKQGQEVCNNPDDGSDEKRKSAV